MTTDTTRKLRSDLTPAERERAERIGSIEFKSPRDANRKSHGAVQVFLPSQSQH
jgi:hypothetical protein